MPLYRYEALDRTGNPVVGAMQVTDENALLTRLTAMGYRLTAAHPATHPVGAGSSAAAASTSTSVFPAGASRLSAGERAVARMLHQLHLSFRAGMPAYQAITTVAGQVNDRSLRQALSEMAQGVQAGSAISTQMERYPRIFSRGDVGTIRAAERAGFLPEGFQGLAIQHEQDDNTRRRLKVWLWFLHLNVFGLFLIIPAAAFLAASIPALDWRPGAAAAAKWLLYLSLPLMGAYIAANVVLERSRRDPKLAYRKHRLLMKLPMAGRINQLRSNAVFTRTLQWLYRAGVGPAQAWDTAAGSVPNLYIAEQYAAGLPYVESTSRFSAGLQASRQMDLADVGMVATGESSGDVEEALSYLAKRYEEETEVALGASVVKGAVTITLWAFIMGGVAMAVVAWGYSRGLLALAGMGE